MSIHVYLSHTNQQKSNIMGIVHMAGVLLFALAVALGGLFMLAYSKKENLGRFYSISALVAVIFACSVFVFGIAGGIMCTVCGHCKDGKKGKMKHMMMMERMHGGRHGNWMQSGECEMGGNGGSCYRGMKCGGGMEACEGMKMHGCKDMKKCKMGDKMKKEMVIEIDNDDAKNADTRVKKDETVK